MTASTMATDETATSAVPLLPWEWYRDERVLEVEEQRLFRSSWQYVGSLERLQDPGDHVVAWISRTPVVVVRTEDGTLRAHLNVCRHRGSVVVGADGNATRFQCPYHAWTYGLDGSLRSAPRCGPEVESELGSLGLLPVRVDTFGPFVFVKLSDEGPALAEVVGGLDEMLRGVGIVLDGLRLRDRWDYEVPGNWKIAVENYLECYHCPVAHPGFSAVMEVGPERYVLSETPHRLSHLSPLRTATRSEYPAQGSVTAGSYHMLLPNIKLNVNPGRQNLSIGPLYPAGVGRTSGFLDYYFGADADEAWVAAMMEFDNEVGREDNKLIADTQRGMAGSWIDRGRILPQERLIASFQRHVQDACGPEVARLRG